MPSGIECGGGGRDDATRTEYTSFGMTAKEGGVGTTLKKGGLKEKASRLKYLHGSSLEPLH